MTVNKYRNKCWISEKLMINRLLIFNVANFELRKLLKICFSNLNFISPVLFSDRSYPYFITLLLGEMRWWPKEEIKARGVQHGRAELKCEQRKRPIFKVRNSLRDHKTGTSLHSMNRFTRDIPHTKHLAITSFLESTPSCTYEKFWYFRSKRMAYGNM